MNKEVLNKITEKQKAIEDKIYKIAEENGLSNETVAPIVDGIVDIEQFMGSDLPVGIILKEPYDDTSDGQAVGGGWSFADCFKADKNSFSKAWEPMVYTMYGVENNLWWWQMDYLREDPSMIKALYPVSWINLSKMPNKTYSNNLDVKRKYQKLWRPVIKEQIEGFDHKILIFAGTLDLCVNEKGENDFLTNDYEPVKTQYIFGDLKKTAQKLKEKDNINFQNRKIEVYECPGKPVIIKAPHPSCHSNPGEEGLQEQYVNALIDSIRKYKKQ